jgi:hypothetical protein
MSEKCPEAAIIASLISVATVAVPIFCSSTIEKNRA